jgi:hypothetical protein
MYLACAEACEFVHNFEKCMRKNSVRNILYMTKLKFKKFKGFFQVPILGLKSCFINHVSSKSQPFFFFWILYKNYVEKFLCKPIPQE